MKKVEISGGKWKLAADYKTMVFDRTKNVNAATEMNVFLIMLLNNGYEARVYAEESLYIIEYNNDPSCFDYGDDRLMWVAAEEEEHIHNKRDNEERNDECDEYDDPRDEEDDRGITLYDDDDQF